MFSDLPCGPHSPFSVICLMNNRLLCFLIITLWASPFFVICLMNNRLLCFLITLRASPFFVICLMNNRLLCFLITLWASPFSVYNVWWIIDYYVFWLLSCGPHPFLLYDWLIGRTRDAQDARTEITQQISDIQTRMRRSTRPQIYLMNNRLLCLLIITLWASPFSVYVWWIID